MLNPIANRIDYGTQLMPPDGYAFKCGIATSFGVDLETLVAASIALTLDHTLEGDLSGEKLAFLESLDRLQGRLLVFYQSGKIKIPSNFNRLFTLLEPLLAPALPSTAFSSFHPKVWLLRFSSLDEMQPARFRLLVLSRNLTFDRSWDIALTIDGEAVKRGGNTDVRLLEFVRSLPTNATQIQFVESLCESLDGVSWSLPPNFDFMQMLPGGPSREGVPATAPLVLEDTYDELIVMSPFVDADAQSMLVHLGKHTSGAKTLISRADTLDRIGSVALEGWQCHSVPTKIIDGEEYLEQAGAARQDLHAKLIVTSRGKVASWHVGSANMTNAAFGTPYGHANPRNTEFMVRLSGPNKIVGPARLLEDWQRNASFEPHEFSAVGDEDSHSNPKLRLLVFALASANWVLSATEIETEVFSVCVTVKPLPNVPPGFTVDIGLLSQAAYQPLAAIMDWDAIKLTDVSGFIPVEIKAPTLGIHECFAVQAQIDLSLMEARKKAVYKSTVDSPEKVLAYLSALLDTDNSKTRWMGHNTKKVKGSDVFGMDLRGGLYEQLMRSAARDTRRLERVLLVFERLGLEGAPLPDGLKALLAGFASQLGGKT